MRDCPILRGTASVTHVASRLVMNGVDLRTVQELMDTRLFSMTYRYAHLAASHKLAARAIGCSGRSQRHPELTHRGRFSLSLPTRGHQLSLV